MGILSKEAYERKAAWADRRMRENAENCDSLTEEQHEKLAELCALRHELHISHEDVWIGETETAFDRLDDCCGGGLLSELSGVGLPPLKFPFPAEDIPLETDYYNVLSEDERDEWDRKAEEIDENMTGVDLWREESGECSKCFDMLEQCNDVIEKYLAAIDKKHGTNYCPSGVSRIPGANCSEEPDVSLKNGCKPKSPRL